jgi:hypothetical protein
MPGRSYPIAPRVLHAFVLGMSLASLSSTLACGDDEGPGTVKRDPPDGGDGGSLSDAMVPIDEPDPPGPPRPPRDVPAELEGQTCAVEFDDLYELVTVRRPPQPTQLGVDVVGSRFAVGFIDDSDTCTDAVYLAQLEGGSGIGPTITPAVDPCTSVEHAAVAYNGEAWLLAAVDAREGSSDLWVQAYEPGGAALPAHRITQTTAIESEPVLALSSDGHVIIAWYQHDAVSNSGFVAARALSRNGAPEHDIVIVDEIEGSASGLTLAPIGTSLVALGYRRDSGAQADLVLQVLDAATGEPDHEAWTLTTSAGDVGAIDITGDAQDGAAIYSVIQDGIYQLWFQKLGADGRAELVSSGEVRGDPSPAVRVIGPPKRAVDASVTKVNAGFVIAYRALVGGQILSSRIRVHFLDRFGRVIGDSGVALASEYGGRTAIESAYDGRIVVGWSDSSDDGKTTIKAVKLPCVGNQ